jgi:3D (Asp-Asp-Asp) domain-containing protein
MKRFLTALALITLFAPNTFAGFLWKREKPQSKLKSQPVLARVTVYWASGGRGSDRYTRQHKCSTGLRLRPGHCAVDPQKIPYGSNIVFPDGTSLAAVDTGTAVKNRKAARLSGQTTMERNAPVIDRFFETKKQALTWASTHPLFVSVRVIPPRSQIASSLGQAQSVRRAIATRHSVMTASAATALILPKVR